MPEVSNNRPDPQYLEKLEQICTRLRTHAGPIYVAAHEDPDGDAIGSILGLSRALHELGLDVRPVGVAPRYLQFLSEVGELRASEDPLPMGSLLVALDSGDKHRVIGVPIDQPGIPVINIDHHGTNSRFGEIALVEPGKPAAALIVKELIDHLGVAWSERLATPVLTGMITDTGSFRFSSTTPETLHAAADLIAAGARLGEINERLATQPRSYLRLQAEVLTTVTYELDGLLITAFVNDAMVERVGASWEEVEALVNLIRSAEGTYLAALFKDRGDSVKLSLRSRVPVSAQNVAVACGGGGHVAAAGATVIGSLEAARARLLEATAEEFARVGLRKN